jgi:hypothetical protein
VNADGAVDVSDLSALGALVNNGPPYDACQFWRSDVDGDGDLTVNVDPSDATVLAEFLYGSGTLACVP